MIDINKLESYANIDNNENGEICLLLIDLYSYGDYINEKFQKQLENEIIAQLKLYEDNFNIVYKEVTTQSTGYVLEEK